MFVFILCLFFIVGCGDMTANNKTRMDDLLNGASLTLLPNALTAPGYFYDTQCLATLTSLAPGPHADLVHESALTSGNYATLSVDTGASVRTECYASAGVLNELVEFGFDTSSLNLSQYSSLTVTWVGSAGVYGSPCDGVSAYVAFSGTGVLSVLDSGGAWDNVGTLTALGTTTVSGTLSNPSHYLTGQTIWVRMTGSTGDMGACNGIATEHLQLVLSQ